MIVFLLPGFNLLLTGAATEVLLREAPCDELAALTVVAGFTGE